MINEIKGAEYTTCPEISSNVTELYIYNTNITSLPTLPPTLINLYCYNNKLTSLLTLPTRLILLVCHNNPIIWYPKHTHLVLKGKYKYQRLVCIYITRDIAARIIQRNCKRWIDKPITRDGRLGLSLRIGLRKHSNYDSMYPQSKEKL